MTQLNRNFLKSSVRPSLRLFVGLAVIIVVWGCSAVPQLHEGGEMVNVRLPFVRVLVENNSPEVKISSHGSYSLEGLIGDKSYVYYSSHPIQIRPDRGMMSLSLGRDKIGERYDEVMVMPRGGDGYLEFNGKGYRGMLRIVRHGMNLMVINVAHIDDYLKGVVPPEMGKVGDSDLEAIKAQAVAARTYSMSRLSQYPGESYDLRNDVTDQLYEGVEAEVPLISKAIDATRGYVIKFQDGFITAYYHSTCGGYTDDIEEVWDKPAAPYLRAVDDSGACSWSKYYRWHETYTAQQLKMRLEQYLSADRGREVHLDDITDIRITSRTAGGRVAEMILKTTSRDYTFGKDKIRWVFKRSSNPELILQSAKFDVEPLYDNNGRLIKVDFAGGGYGHGVGMCQCGAMGMARRGKKFDQILKFYYRNTNLVKLY
ncbi:conserved hypothetical protein [Candidatus Zixiibacteriota bacterium]|nr:conserved hypothetical protein [candidate division Zixibacteria bacterium]